MGLENCLTLLLQENCFSAYDSKIRQILRNDKEANCLWQTDFEVEKFCAKIT